MFINWTPNGFSFDKSVFPLYSFLLLNSIFYPPPQYLHVVNAKHWWEIAIWNNSDISCILSLTFSIVNAFSSLPNVIRTLNRDRASKLKGAQTSLLNIGYYLYNVLVCMSIQWSTYYEYYSICINWNISSIELSFIQ